MTAALRSLTMPALAVVAAGAVALAPAVTAPTAPTPAIPAVHVENVQLAGWFTDSVLYWTDLAAATAIAAVAPIPVIGPPIADQISINYFGGIRPLAVATSAYVTSWFADPLGFPVHTVNFALNVGYIGYQYVNKQVQFLGLPGLPFIPAPPPVAAVAPGRTSPAAVRAAATPGQTPAAASARPAASQARQSARAAASVAVEGETSPDAPAASAPHKAKASRAEARTPRAASASRR